MPAPTWIPDVGDEVSVARRDGTRVYGWVVKTRWDGTRNVVDMRIGDGRVVRGIPWEVLQLDTAPERPTAGPAPAEPVVEGPLTDPTLDERVRTALAEAAPQSAYRTSAGESMRRRRAAIEEAGLTARTLREWALEHGVEVGTVGMPGWDVLKAYLDAQRDATAASAAPAPAVVTRPATKPSGPRGSLRWDRRRRRWKTTCTACGPLAINAHRHPVALAALNAHVRTHRAAALEGAPRG